MRRRTALALLISSTVARPPGARAQKPQKLPRIGFLSDQSERPHLFNARDYFLNRLRELGYEDGRDLVIEYRYAAGELSRLPALASELSTLPVDVLIAVGTPASKAAVAATKTIPIVFFRVADPVGSGLVTGLARPGGNATGTALMTPDLAGKRLQLLKEVAPRVTRIAVVHEKNFQPGDNELKHLLSAAPRLGLEIHAVAVQPPLATALDAAVSEIIQASSGALFIGASGWFEDLYENTLDMVNKCHLPALYVRPEFVEAGGLMSYGPSYAQMYRISADYVDRILKGANPADLPVQQPSKFELVINMKAAKTIDLTIPPILLSLADRVIE